MSDKREKRRYLRVYKRIPIAVKSLKEDWTEETETENFSTHGCLFLLKQRVRVGEHLQILTTAPDALIECEVARYTAKQGLVGVKFSPNLKWIELFAHYAKPEDLRSNY